MNAAKDLRGPQRDLDHLVDLLGHERTLLSQGRIDGEALARVAAEKQQMLDALSEFEQRHRGGRDGKDATGDDLHARAREAARLNRFNGVLIAARMLSNRRLLNDLGNLGGNNLYGPDGEATNGHSRLASQA